MTRGESAEEAATVEGRRNSASDDWLPAPYLSPQEARALNRALGWTKYRVWRAP